MEPFKHPDLVLEIGCHRCPLQFIIIFMFPGSILSDSTALAALFSAALTKKKTPGGCTGLGTRITRMTGGWVQQPVD